MDPPSGECPPGRPPADRTRSARRACAWALLFWGTLGCSGDASTAAPEPVFRIGVLALFDGVKTAGSGLPTLEGSRMAAQELNEAGGVDIDGVRHRIDIVERRHPFRIEEVTTAARSLVNRDSVHALLGPQYSQHAVPVGAIAERAGVPMISPMSSSPATTAGRSYVFRIAFLDAAQGQILAEFSREVLGLDRVAVVRSLTSPYSSDVADRFIQVFEELGGEVIESSFPGGGPPVARAAFREILARNPQRVLLPLETEEVAEILQLMEEEGFEVGLLGTDSWDTALLEGMAAARDAYVAHQWMATLPEPRTEAFATLYRETFGELPRSTAALTYDAVQILARAASAARSLDGARLRDAIQGLPSHEGVSGVIHFDGTQDPTRPVIISRTEDGRAMYSAALSAR